MINTELIARAICQHGKCKTCDPDCVDYRAACRVMKAIEKDKEEIPQEIFETKPTMKKWMPST